MTEEAGARAAWVGQVLDQYETPLIRYAQQLTGDLELARDIVQDTFVQVCRADRNQIEGHLGPWLYRVCRNRALDVLKKERRMQRLETQQAEAQPSGWRAPGEIAEGHETEQMLLRAVSSLPEKQREVFQLKFQNQMSYKEISEVTGFPLNHVRYLLHTSLKTLREQLRGRIEVAEGL